MSPPDIVQRLREMAGRGRIDVSARMVMDEAADEIENLRGGLAIVCQGDDGQWTRCADNRAELTRLRDRLAAAEKIARQHLAVRRCDHHGNYANGYDRGLDDAADVIGHAILDALGGSA